MNNPAEKHEEAAVGSDSARPPFRPLRVWPAVLLTLLMLAGRFGPELSQDAMAKYWMASVFGPMLCTLLLLIWWLAASRATWRERVFGLLGLVAGLVIAVTFSHRTMRGVATSYLTLPMGLFLFGMTAALLKRSVPAVRTGMAVLLDSVRVPWSLRVRSSSDTTPPTGLETPPVTPVALRGVGMAPLMTCWATVVEDQAVTSAQTAEAKTVTRIG